MELMIAFNIFMRVVHILSAILLLGGVFAWRFGGRKLSADPRSEMAETMVAAWRPVTIAAVAGLLISGMWNFLQKTGLTSTYHAIFGIKVLLALDVFAVAILAMRPGNTKRNRQLTHAAIAGVLIVVLSAVLRALSLR